MNHVAYDYETTYSDSRDIRKLGVTAYLRHPETDIYLVSLFGDGVEYVGRPKDAPWHLLEGRPVVAHNLGFDSEVSVELRRRGVPVPEHKEAYCTADMAACMQVKRDLGTATRVLEGVLLNKAVRGKMKNQTWETMSEDFRKEASAYALDDAKASWLLWENHSHEFTPLERRLSEHTRLMTSRGIHLNSEQIRKDLEWLTPMLAAAEKEIPWLGELDAKGKEVKLTSPKRLLQECEKLGVPAPLTTDAKDERFGDWADEYADQAPFVAAIQQWRKINRFIVWCESVLARSIDGRLRYSLKYCGAPHTRRWAGAEGVNLQAVAKRPLVAREIATKLGKDDAWLTRNGIDPESLSDMRGHLMPAPGHKFITADLSQIEPRVLAYLAGQHKLLDLMRTGMDVYEAQARAMDLYSDPGKLKIVNPPLRQTVKVLNLGLGYGLGEAGLMRSYRRMSGKVMPAAEAARLVELYRSKNPEIAGKMVGGYCQGGLWGMLNDVCKKAAWTDGRVNFDLPSGRTLRYWDVRNDPTEGMLCVTERGSPPKHCWRGRATENVVQAVARDVFAKMILTLEDDGLPVVMHTHDELSCEVPEDRAEEACEHVTRVMSTSPEWAPGLPVMGAAGIHDRYEKD